MSLRGVQWPEPVVGALPLRAIVADGGLLGLPGDSACIVASRKLAANGLCGSPQPSSSLILSKPDKNSLMDWCDNPHIALAGLPTQVVNDKGRSHQQPQFFLFEGDRIRCRHGSFALTFGEHETQEAVNHH